MEGWRSLAYRTRFEIGQTERSRGFKSRPLRHKSLNNPVVYVIMSVKMMSNNRKVYKMQFIFKDPNEFGEPLFIDEFYRDIIMEYIPPERLLSDEEQIAEVKKAIGVVREYLNQVKKSELLEF